MICLAQQPNGNLAFPSVESLTHREPVASESERGSIPAQVIAQAIPATEGKWSKQLVF